MPNPDPDVHILVSGGTLVHNSREALTGQTIAATLSFSGTINSITWSVSGSVFKTWSETTMPQYVDLSPDDLKATNLSFNDKTNGDKVTIGCTGTYTNLDGDTLPFNPTPQTVTFMKPTATWPITTGYVQELTPDPGSQCAGYLLFNLLPGSSPASSGASNNGMEWQDVTITLPADLSGSGGNGCFGQLITPYHPRPNADIGIRHIAHARVEQRADLPGQQFPLRWKL